jgi:thymidine kinase
VDIVKGNMGWIEVVVGPMFSGKSEELIRRLRRAEIARQRVQIFKPAIDARYAANEIVSHSGLGIPSDNVAKASEIMEKLQPRTEVVGIDEAQFLGDEVVDVCTKLANLGKRVIVAGLDTDYKGRPFEPMPRLLAIAEEITKLLAICVRCGNPQYTPSAWWKAMNWSWSEEAAPMKRAAAVALNRTPRKRAAKPAPIWRFARVRRLPPASK